MAFPFIKDANINAHINNDSPLKLSIGNKLTGKGLYDTSNIYYTNYGVGFQLIDNKYENRRIALIDTSNQQKFIIGITKNNCSIITTDCNLKNFPLLINSNLYINNSNIGIGTINPSSNINLNGDVSVKGKLNVNNKAINSVNNLDSSNLKSTGTSYLNNLSINGTFSNIVTGIIKSSQWSNQIFVGNPDDIYYNLGNVGIGISTINNLNKLEVLGKIKSTNLIVDNLILTSGLSNINNIIFNGATINLNSNLTINQYIGIGTNSPSSLLEIVNKNTINNSSILVIDSLTNNQNIIGKPLIKIGKKSSNINSYYGIGFGYSPLITNKSPAEIGYVTTDITSNTKGKLIFATRNTTDGNVTANERMTISSTGNIGINDSPSLNSTLKVFVTGGIKADNINAKFAGSTTGLLTSNNNINIITSNNSINFITNNNEILRILSNGSIGIGKTVTTSGFLLDSQYKITSIFLSVSNVTTPIINNTCNQLTIGTVTPFNLNLNVSNTPKLIINNQGDLIFSGNISKSGDFNIFSTENLGSIRFSNQNLERLTITEKYNVGIGVTNPNIKNKLEVLGRIKSTFINFTGSVNANIMKNISDCFIGTVGTYSLNLLTNNSNRFTVNSSNGNIDITGNISKSNNLNLNLNANTFAGKLLFNTNNNERIRIDEVGNIGIGTKNPISLLDIINTVSTTITNPVLTIDTYNSISSNIGQPLMQIYKKNKNNPTTSYYSIGFGYSPSIGNYNPAEIGYITTDITNNTSGDIILSLRENTDANTKAIEKIKIANNGNLTLTGNVLNTGKLNINTNYLSINPNNIQTLIIDNSCNVGIKTTIPSSSFEIIGNNIVFNNPIFTIDSYNNTNSSTPNAIGQPLLKIGKISKKTSINSYYGIGFGYSPLITDESPAEIGFLTTNIGGNTYGDIIFATRNTNVNNIIASERLRINSKGFVGIGTNNPNCNLDIIGDVGIFGNLNLNNRAIRGVSNFDTSNIQTKEKLIANNIVISGNYSNILSGILNTSKWDNQNSNLYYILGNVAIGKDNPTSTLDIDGKIKTSNIQITNSIFTSVINNNRLNFNNIGTNNFTSFSINNNERLRLDGNCNIIIYNINNIKRFQIDKSSNIIIFNSSTENEVIKIDSNDNFIYYNKNGKINLINDNQGNIGIGTAVNSSKIINILGNGKINGNLEINGTITGYSFFNLAAWSVNENNNDLLYHTCNIGIGTSYTSVSLEVNSNIRIDGNLQIYNQDNTFSGFIQYDGNNKINLVSANGITINSDYIYDYSNSTFPQVKFYAENKELPNYFLPTTLNPTFYYYNNNYDSEYGYYLFTKDVVISFTNIFNTNNNLQSFTTDIILVGAGGRGGNGIYSGGGGGGEVVIFSNYDIFNRPDTIQETNNYLLKIGIGATSLSSGNRTTTFSRLNNTSYSGSFDIKLTAKGGGDGGEYLPVYKAGTSGGSGGGAPGSPIGNVITVSSITSNTSFITFNSGESYNINYSSTSVTDVSQIRRFIFTSDGAIFTVKNFVNFDIYIGSADTKTLNFDDSTDIGSVQNHASYTGGVILIEKSSSAPTRYSLDSITGDSCVYFNGSSDNAKYFKFNKIYSSYNTASGLNGFGFSFWVKLNATTGKQVIVGNMANYLNATDYKKGYSILYDLDTTPPTFKVDFISDAGSIPIIIDYEYNNWVFYQIGFVILPINGITIIVTICRNGVVKLTKIMTTYILFDSSSIEYRISQRRVNNITSYFNGYLDNFKYYDGGYAPWTSDTEFTNRSSIDINYFIFNQNRDYPILKNSTNTTINPIAWYNFDNSSGNSKGLDVSGNAYTLTSVNTSNSVISYINVIASYSASPRSIKYSDYREFCKGTNSVQFYNTSNANLRNTSINMNIMSKNFSISFWSKLITYNRNNPIFEYGHVNTDTILQIGYNSTNNIYFNFYNSTSSDNLITSAAYTDYEWVFLTFTYNYSGNTRRIYRNGVEIINKTTSSRTLNSSLPTSVYIGMHNYPSASYFNGFLDDFRIYDIELSSSQVVNLHKGNINVLTNTYPGTAGTVSGPSPGVSGSGTSYTFSGENGSSIKGGNGGGFNNSIIETITGQNLKLGYGGIGAPSILPSIVANKVKIGEGGDGGNGQYGSDGAIIIKIPRAIVPIIKYNDLLTKSYYSSIDNVSNIISKDLIIQSDIVTNNIYNKFSYISTNQYLSCVNLYSFQELNKYQLLNYNNFIAIQINYVSSSEYTFQVTRYCKCKLILVGGGGANSMPTVDYIYVLAGGGGSGGVVYIDEFELYPGIYTYKIGKGGISINDQIVDGENSYLKFNGRILVAAGGGGGGSYSATINGNNGIYVQSEYGVNSGGGGGGCMDVRNNTIYSLGGSGNGVAGNGKTPIVSSGIHYGGGGGGSYTISSDYTTNNTNIGGSQFINSASFSNLGGGGSSKTYSVASGYNETPPFYNSFGAGGANYIYSYSSDNRNGKNGVMYLIFNNTSSNIQFQNNFIVPGNTIIKNKLGINNLSPVYDVDVVGDLNIANGLITRNGVDYFQNLTANVTAAENIISSDDVSIESGSSSWMFIKIGFQGVVYLRNNYGIGINDYPRNNGLSINNNTDNALSIDAIYSKVFGEPLVKIGRKRGKLTLNYNYNIGFGYSVFSDSPASIGFKVNDISGYTKGDLLFSTRDLNNVVERLTITSSGNIGVGTTIPLSLFETINTNAFYSNAIVTLDANDTNKIGDILLKLGKSSIKSSGNSYYGIGFGYSPILTDKCPAEIGFITTNNTGNTRGDLIFALRNTTTNTTATERVRIDGLNGNIGVGGAPSTVASTKLKIYGNIDVIDTNYVIGSVYTNAIRITYYDNVIIQNTQTNKRISFKTGATERLYIDSNINITGNLFRLSNELNINSPIISIGNNEIIINSNVGIGGSAGNEKFKIYGNLKCNGIIKGTCSNAIGLSNNNIDAIIQNVGIGKSISFIINGYEQLNIGVSSNVTIAGNIIKTTGDLVINPSTTLNLGSSTSPEVQLNIVYGTVGFGTTPSLSSKLIVSSNLELTDNIFNNTVSLNINPSKKLLFNTNNINRININNSTGNVGINGESVFNSKLKVYGDLTVTNFINGTLQGDSTGVENTTNVIINASSNNNIYFRNNGTDKITVDGNGNIGIGINANITEPLYIKHSSTSLQGSSAGLYLYNRNSGNLNKSILNTEIFAKDFYSFTGYQLGVKGNYNWINYVKGYSKILRFKLVSDFTNEDMMTISNGGSCYVKKDVSSANILILTETNLFSDSTLNNSYISFSPNESYFKYNWCFLRRITDASTNNILSFDFRGIICQFAIRLFSLNDLNFNKTLLTVNSGDLDLNTNIIVKNNVYKKIGRGNLTIGTLRNSYSGLFFKTNNANRFIIDYNGNFNRKITYTISPVIGNPSEVYLIVDKTVNIIFPFSVTLKKYVIIGAGGNGGNELYGGGGAAGIVRANLSFNTFINANSAINITIGQGGSENPTILSINNSVIDTANAGKNVASMTTFLTQYYGASNDLYAGGIGSVGSLQLDDYIVTYYAGGGGAGSTSEGGISYLDNVYSYGGNGGTGSGYNVTGEMLTFAGGGGGASYVNRNDFYYNTNYGLGTDGGGDGNGGSATTYGSGGGGAGGLGASGACILVFNASSFTGNQVIYNEIANNFSVLFENGNIGFGTTPNYKLHVVGTTNLTNNVGIGVVPSTDPNSKLKVKGDIEITGIISSSLILSKAAGLRDNPFIYVSSIDNNNRSIINAYFNNNIYHDNDKNLISTDSTKRFYFKYGNETNLLTRNTLTFKKPTENLLTVNNSGLINCSSLTIPANTVLTLKENIAKIFCLNTGISEPTVYFEFKKMFDFINKAVTYKGRVNNTVRLDRGSIIIEEGLNANGVEILNSYAYAAGKINYNDTGIIGGYFYSSQTFSGDNATRANPIFAEYNPSFVVEGGVLCKNPMFISSDKRIKDNIQNTDNALDIILNLKPKKYEYIENTCNKNFGFVAQEVEKLLPEAIQLNNEYIPNIYKMARVDGNLLTLDIDISDKIHVNDDIRLIDKNNRNSYKIIEIVNINTFKINSKLDVDEIFVYGINVNDFHVLDTKNIYSLNVSAVQQLHKKLEILEEIINNQQIEIDNLLNNLLSK